MNTRSHALLALIPAGNFNTKALKSKHPKHWKAMKAQMIACFFCCCFAAMAAPPALPRSVTPVDRPVQNPQLGQGGAPCAPLAYLADEAPLAYPAVEAQRAQPAAKAPLAQPAPRAPLAQPAPRAPRAQPAPRAPLAQPAPRAPRAPNALQPQFAPGETSPPSTQSAQSAPSAPRAPSTPAAPSRMLVGRTPNQFGRQSVWNPTTTNPLEQGPQPALTQEQLNRMNAQVAVRNISLTNVSNAQAPERYGLDK